MSQVLFPHFPAHQHHVQSHLYSLQSAITSTQEKTIFALPSLKYHTTHQRHVHKKLSLLPSKHHRVQAGENFYRPSLRYGKPLNRNKPLSTIGNILPLARGGVKTRH